MRQFLLAIFVFVSLPLLCLDYAGMYIDNNMTNQASSWSANTWYQVTGFSASEISSDWSYSSDQLTHVGTPDVYLVKYSLSYSGTVANWEVGVGVNGAAPVTTVSRRIVSASDYGNVSGTQLVSLPAGGDLELFVRADQSIASFVPVDAQVTVYESKDLSSAYYAEAGIYVSGTPPYQTLASSSSWYTVNGFSPANSTFMQDAVDGWTFNTNNLICHGAAAGVYWVSYAISFEGDSGTDYEYDILRNGTPVHRVSARRHITSSSNFGNASSANYITVSDGDAISLGVTSDNNGDRIQVQYCNLVLVRVSGASGGQAPYGSMRVVNNTNTIALSQGAWVKETNTSVGFIDPNYWVYNSGDDSMTPHNLSAGRYLVNYDVSASVPSGVTTQTFNCAADVFIAGAQTQDLTGMRTLQRKAGGDVDLGCISGVAIVDILDPGDTIELFMSNTSNSSTINFVTRYASVSVMRLEEMNGGELPVELSSFSADVLNNGDVQIMWATASETDLAGYYIYRNTTLDFDSAVRITPGLIPATNLSTGATYTFIDTETENSASLFYWLQSMELTGESEFFGPVFASPGNSDLQMAASSAMYDYPGGVEIDWATAYESTGLVGFHLYRAEEPSLGDAELVNDAMIFAAHSSQGASYNYTDADVEQGRTYYYWISSENWDNVLHLEGPLRCEAPFCAVNDVQMAVSDRVAVSWFTDFENDIASYELYRCATPDRDDAVLAGATDARGPYRNHKIVDSGVEPGATYTYWLEALTNSGYREGKAVLNAACPYLTVLYAAYPNPFNPETTISFCLDEETDVKLTVYDVKGRKVRTLLDREAPIGVTSIIWDGRNDAGKVVASGVYFYRLDAGDWSSTRKVILMK